MTPSDHYSYNRDFYNSATQMNFASARMVTARVKELLNVTSVVDFGCAQGAWLVAWRELGVTDLLGVDSAYVDPADLLMDPHEFRVADLGEPVDLGRRFDLALSLEVAEHLPAAQADHFVENLTRHASIILFSAAPPGQGGEHHVNEQPYAYWRDLFARKGFFLFDCIRPLIDVREVQPWYRFNIFLFVHEAAIAGLPSSVVATGIDPNGLIPDRAPWDYRLRKSLVRRLSPGVQSRIARWLVR